MKNKLLMTVSTFLGYYCGGTKPILPAMSVFLSGILNCFSSLLTGLIILFSLSAAVKLLLDMGSDINAQIETNRNTALTLACFQVGSRDSR
jgi:hypothetical protein